ncbi:MAG: DNA polymerase III subunit alpha [Candidatus Pelagibacter sp. TMED196]|nr:MAG: DNA polymerase III subunit alpha [Candidatus Pelagibacter sp. TMED196]|tara:strand:+ start:802 stop:4224 length:3423 start_codon:yes stop_codon:yes gene_type:complete
MFDAKQKFNNFKIHTQYSICEGAIKIEELAEYCKKNKIRSVGLSDSFNLCGALEFSEAISKVGTQPIIGTQINFKYNETIGKLPIFAKTERGYNNLVKLSSKSYLETKESFVPTCYLNDLFDNCNDLLVLSGGIDSLFNNLVKKNKMNEVYKLASILKNNFSNSFYLEIQRHNDTGEPKLEDIFLNLSEKENIPLIASQEVFYINRDMYEAHDALLCIGEKTYVDEINRKKYSGNHYIRTNEELTKLYSDIPEALENNYNFPFRFSYKVKKSKPVLPSIKISNSRNENDELTFQSNEGLKNRLKNFILKKKDKINLEKIKKKYFDRLSHELSIIHKMNYSGYFLIVSDYIKWAKLNDIPVGPGRGSGAGSLVAYSLDITDLDPIEFGLIFERFLNPDRISMPDFDIDFCEEKRDLVFNYLKSKYKNGVAHIITFGKLKARMALRDIGRVIGLPYGHVDKICKMIPFDPSRPLSLQESIDREPRFKQEEKNNPKVKKLIALSLKLEGLNRNLATHAAGVVIAGEKLSEEVPLYRDNSSNLLLPSTQFDMHSSENAGLVKFDILGLNTLTLISKTIKILKSKNIDLDISKISLNDSKVYEMLSTGETTGLFQLESTGVRSALKQMKPNKFEDIIALVALYRPGPMNNIPIYNDCKNGLKKPDYIHESLEKILKPTYGIIIYQEQVMQIAQTLANFSPGEADILRKAMGKKKRKELEKQEEKFIKGATKNGIGKDIAVFIFQKIKPFAEYGFNKSHAAAYALIAYQTAYLKKYFPEDFIAATMSTELSNTDKLREFVEELKRLKIEIIRPSINKSYADFISKKGKIYYALSAIKSVGKEAVSNIIKEREKNGKFETLNDFINRVNPKDINKLQLEGLVKAGAFDELFNDRGSLLKAIPKIIQVNKTFWEEKISNQTSLFSNKSENDETIFKLEKNKETDSKKDILLNEFQSIGFYMSDHPLNAYKDYFDELKIKSFSSYVQNSDSNGYVAGTIMSIQEKKSAKGTPFAIIKFSDLKSEYELFIFSDLLISNREKLKTANSFLITLQKDNLKDLTNSRRINIKNIVPINDFINKSYDNVTIEINGKTNMQDLKILLNDTGETKIQLKVNRNSKIYIFSLKNRRKFNLNKLSALKNKEYIKKISF